MEEDDKGGRHWLNVALAPRGICKVKGLWRKGLFTLGPADKAGYHRLWWREAGFLLSYLKFTDNLEWPMWLCITPKHQSKLILALHRWGLLCIYFLELLSVGELYTHIHLVLSARQAQRSHHTRNSSASHPDLVSANCLHQNELASWKTDDNRFGIRNIQGGKRILSVNKSALVGVCQKDRGAGWTGFRSHVSITGQWVIPRTNAK